MAGINLFCIEADIVNGIIIIAFSNTLIKLCKFEILSVKQFNLTTEPFRPSLPPYPTCTISQKKPLIEKIVQRNNERTCRYLEQKSRVLFLEESPPVLEVFL